MARPELVIEERQVETLASIGCTVADIALVIGCSKDTLERRFAAAIEKGRASARGSLLKKQYELALSGNVTMLVWLGKQRLGQTDRAETTVVHEEKVLSREERETRALTLLKGTKTA